MSDRGIYLELHNILHKYGVEGEIRKMPDNVCEPHIMVTITRGSLDFERSLKYHLTYAGNAHLCGGYMGAWTPSSVWTGAANALQKELYEYVRTTEYGMLSSTKRYANSECRLFVRVGKTNKPYEFLP